MWARPARRAAIHAGAGSTWGQRGSPGPEPGEPPPRRRPRSFPLSGQHPSFPTEDAFLNLLANSPPGRVEKLGRCYRVVDESPCPACLLPPCESCTLGHGLILTGGGRAFLSGLAGGPRHSGDAADPPDRQPPLGSYSDLEFLCVVGVEVGRYYHSG